MALAGSEQEACEQQAEYDGDRRRAFRSGEHRDEQRGQARADGEDDVGDGLGDRLEEGAYARLTGVYAQPLRGHVENRVATVEAHHQVVVAAADGFERAAGELKGDWRPQAFAPSRVA